MRNSEWVSALQDLIAYFGSYELKQQSENDDIVRFVRAIYKKYHSLLIWHGYIHSKKLPGDFAGQYDSSVLFLDEAVSDLCQAQLMFVNGFYKPYHMLLRSAVENSFRFVGLQQGQSVMSIGSVYELVAVLRDTKLMKDNKEALTFFNLLHVNYKNACNYVHTSTANHMSLTTSIGVFPGFDKKKAEVAAKEITSVMTAIIGLLAVIFPAYMKRFHHKDLDFVLETIPKRTRRVLMSN